MFENSRLKYTPSWECLRHYSRVFADFRSCEKYVSGPIIFTIVIFIGGLEPFSAAYVPNIMESKSAWFGLCWGGFCVIIKIYVTMLIFMMFEKAFIDRFDDMII